MGVGFIAGILILYFCCRSCCATDEETKHRSVACMLVYLYMYLFKYQSLCIVVYFRLTNSLKINKL